ncbi:hypothetical protein ACFQU9_14630 [Actinomadura namibiensis]
MVDDDKRAAILVRRARRIHPHHRRRAGISVGVAHKPLTQAQTEARQQP